MIKFFIGLFIGAIISLILYACIIVGKQADEKLEAKEDKSE